jgi:hypothetical protein
MGKDLVSREQNSTLSQPAAPEDDKRAAERRRLKDALEDDDVREALMSLHAQSNIRSAQSE